MTSAACKPESFLTLAVVLCLAAAAGAETAATQPAVTLSPAQEPITAGTPWRQARLTFRNTSAGVVREVRLQATEGGPAWVHPVTVAPDGELTLPVTLGAWTQLQSYRYRLVHEDGSVREGTAEIDWPAEVINPQRFIDRRAYERYPYGHTKWSMSVRGSVLLAAGIAAVLLSAALVTRRGIVRLSWVLVVLVVAGAAAWWYVQSLSRVNVRRIDERTIAIAARATDTFEWTGRPLIPLYYSQSQLQQDTTVYYPDRIEVTAVPGDVRIYEVIPPANSGTTTTAGDQ